MKIYNELADWFHLLTAPEDYAEEAAVYLELMGVVAIEHRGSAFHAQEDFRLGIGDGLDGIEKFDMGRFHGSDNGHMRTDHA